jgi:hypothetical protein
LHEEERPKAQHEERLAKNASVAMSGICVQNLSDAVTARQGREKICEIEGKDCMEENYQPREEG